MFWSQVRPNIIAMYPSTTMFIALGQFAIVVLVLFSYALQVHPCRNCLDKVFHARSAEPAPKVVTAGETDDDDEDEEEEVDDGHGGGHVEMSSTKHTVLTTAIIILGFIIAYFVDDLQLGTWTLFLSFSCGDISFVI